MYTYAAKVDIGMSEHQNDDRVLVSDIILTDGIISGKIEKDTAVAAVSDGVGGFIIGVALSSCIRCYRKLEYRILD